MTTIRLIYGNIEEKYNPESYDLFEELIQYVNIYFGFLERKFSVLLADDDGVPIFPIRTIFNSQQITELVKSDAFLITLLITQGTQTYDLQYGQDEVQDQISLSFESKDMKGLMKDIKKIKEQLKNVQLNSGVTNFLVGLTGSGKSTFVNLSRNLQFQFEKKRGRYFIKAPQEAFEEYAPIGNTSQSCTTLPGFYKCKEGTVFCDLAGFLDTNGIKQQILNSYSNRELFRESTLVRIILVVQHGTLESERGGSFITAIQRLQKLFPYDFVNILKYSTMIVVSKSEQGANKKEYIDSIEKIVNSNKNASQECVEFLRQIIKQERVFLFPKPSQVGEEIKIVVSQDIHETINKIPPSLLNHRASISLSQKTQQVLNKLMAKFEKEMEETFDALTLQFNMNLIDLKNPVQLGELCTNISYALKQLDQSKYFPYNLQKIMYAIDLLHLNVNKANIQKYLGNLILTLKKCAQVHNNYQVREGLMDNFMSYFIRQDKLLHQHLQNYYQYDVDLKEIRQQYEEVQRKQDERHQQLRERLREQMRQKQQQNRRRRQQVINQMNRDLERMKRQNARKLQELRRRLG